jgi:hypothetical protein
MQIDQEAARMPSEQGPLIPKDIDEVATQVLARLSYQIKQHLVLDRTNPTTQSTEPEYAMTTLNEEVGDNTSGGASGAGS